MNRQPIADFGDILLVNNPAKWFTPAGVFSALIRARTMSDWSHVAIFINRDVVIEAMPQGVITRNTSVYANVPWRVRTWRDPLLDEEKEMGGQWLIEQIGVPYDWSILWGFLVRSKIAGRNRKWFCSELARGFAAAMGRKLSDDVSHGLTPPAFFAQQEGTFKTIDWQGIKPQGWVAQ